MYSLSKLLPLIFYPLGLSVFLLVCALLLCRRVTLTRIVLGLVLFVLILAGNRLVSSWFLWQLESEYAGAQSFQQADVIIVLGGGTEPPAKYRPIPETSDSGDRVIYAYDLYQKGLAPKILVSGGGQTLASSEARVMSNLLQLLGVPEEDILEEHYAVNTEQNALYSNQLMRELGFESALLVTSAYHMRRASLMFDEHGIVFQPAATDFRSDRSPAYWLTDIFPEARHMASTTLVVKEYLGYWFSQVRLRFF